MVYPSLKSNKKYNNTLEENKGYLRYFSISGLKSLNVNRINKRLSPLFSSSTLYGDTMSNDRFIDRYFESKFDLARDNSSLKEIIEKLEAKKAEIFN